MKPAQTINLEVTTHLHGKGMGIRFFAAKQLAWIIERLLSHKIEISMEAK